MFSSFGPLKKSPFVSNRLALKGQAWITFEQQDDAHRALEALQGARVWGKSMKIRFARFESEIILREQGGEEAVQTARRQREQDKSKGTSVALIQLLIANVSCLLACLFVCLLAYLFLFL